MKTLLLLIVALGLPSLLQAADWNRDFESAQRQARRSGKHLLLYFTADWCGYCKRLERNALNTRRFDKYAEDKLVLFEADFSDRGRRPGRYGVQNHRLQERFGVKGYPTLILLRPNGSYAGDVEYRGGGAEELTTQIDRVRDRKEDRRRHHHRR